MAAKIAPYAVIFVAGLYNRYSLAVLSGALEADARLPAVDLHFLKHPHLAEQAAALAKRYQKVALAWSFHTANVIEISGLIGEVRACLAQDRLTNVLFVAGGAHPSGAPASALQLGLDVVVVGEGEVTFPNLLARYFADEAYTDLKGLSFYDAAGRVQFTGPADPVDLSDFPPFAFKHKRFCPIEISRGCPWGCQFCQTSFFMGGRMRHRSLDNLVKYGELARSIGLRILRFITPASFAYGSPDGRTVNLAALERLLRTAAAMYGKAHVYLGSFPSEVRPEQVSAETLALVRTYCANENIVIGAQSGSETLLQALHRGHGVAEVIRAVELTRAAGLTPHVDFMFGIPGETPRDLAQTLALIERLVNLGARIHSHAFMPLVGTPFAQSQPGVIEPATRQFLFRLQGNRSGHGRWKQHERIAQATTAFLAGQKVCSASYRHKSISAVDTKA